MRFEPSPHPFEIMQEESQHNSEHPKRQDAFTQRMPGCKDNCLRPKEKNDFRDIKGERGTENAPAIRLTIQSPP